MLSARSIRSRDMGRCGGLRVEADGDGLAVGVGSFGHGGLLDTGGERVGRFAGGVGGVLVGEEVVLPLG